MAITLLTDGALRRVVAGLDRVDTGAGTGLDDGGGIIDPLRAGPVALDIDADLSLFVRAILCCILWNLRSPVELIVSKFWKLEIQQLCYDTRFCTKRINVMDFSGKSQQLSSSVSLVGSITRFTYQVYLEI